MSEERLAGLESMASDAMIAARAELMYEFKDGKIGEWDPNYWIRLWQGCDNKVTKKEPEAAVNEDRAE